MTVGMVGNEARVSWVGVVMFRGAKIATTVLLGVVVSVEEAVKVEGGRCSFIFRITKGDRS